MAYLQTSTVIPASPSEVFNYVSDLNRLPETLQDSLEFSWLEPVRPLRVGAEYEFDMLRFGVKVRIRVGIDEMVEGQRITYSQLSGWFRAWQHNIKLSEHGENQTRMIDIVEYTMPLGLLGRLADDLFVRRDLSFILQSRYKRIVEHFSP